MKQWLWSLDFWLAVAAWALLFLVLWFGKREEKKMKRWAAEDKAMMEKFRKENGL